MAEHHAILTVGSTRFDSLVTSFLSPTALAILSSLGIKTALAQIGASELPTGWTEGVNAIPHGVRVEIIRFASDLEDRVGQAELVVSHAGAGSILSFIRPTIPSSAPQRRLVLVPNSTLMDSHQADLADEFGSKGWGTVCENPEALSATLSSLGKPSSASAASYPAYSAKKVSLILDSTLGYS
ncbi:hypothetical protein BCR35DRAFT_198537 [Leucosporidium creatinivorum]|uniref:UDP-N-acetylglucosamine transferase subunit ALG13 n=1 Tax=Leucosporidium creatinivorum TaxID=106004 RepID=A0A1Y2DMM3_9BASI|nr:hypothetical protein BCR35DRAFT_198537 [Leucosporidium creatinivorum]